jgi:hypothetical protein
MQHFFKCYTGKLCSFLLLLLLSNRIAIAQDYQVQRQSALDKLDLAGLDKTLFLNAAVTTQHEVDYLKNLPNNGQKHVENVSAEEWHNLYERLIDADLRPANERIPKLEQLIETDASKLTKSNVVPIGIVNLESIYLTGNQLSENEQRKKEGKTVDFLAYEKFRIVYAAVLQQDVYQADISFRLSPELMVSNSPEKIQNIEIDFDGQGYKTYAISQKLIPYHFESTGKHSLRIRVKTDGKSYVFETYVNVLQLERIKPFMEFDVTAEALTKDTVNGDRAARTNVVGGSIRIILGCDQILDKAIIIGEGFDMGNDQNLDAMEANFRTPFNQYLAEGYDLVFIDYADARAPIENNAQVMKEVIQQINTIKQGNFQNIVIGASMSGLVARYAIRKMEQDGLAHNVRLMICYDTPHQGANVPVGLTQLLWEANPTLLTQVILKFFAKTWRNYYLAMSTPAAQQMLLHWGGHATGGVGSKAGAFDLFRTQLNNLGNGGYPVLSRNIAVIHGSMNAGDRSIFDNYTYGSRLIRSWTPFGLQNTNIDIHTNELGQNTNVLRFASWGIISKRLGVTRSYSSVLNDDFLPGGRSTAPVPNKLFKETSSFNFCFIPTFSSIDYTGSRDTQSQRELLNVTTVNSVTVNRQTPFTAIYGSTNNLNSTHMNALPLDWIGIGFSEGLLTGTGACPALPVPPVPTIETYNACYPFAKKRTTEDNTANITVSLVTPSNGAFIHNWTILPTQQTFTTTSDMITFQAEDPGSYQVICVRTYPGRRDLESTHTANFFVADCGDIILGPLNPDIPLAIEADIDITDVWEGDFLLTTPLPDSLAVFAHYTSGDFGVLYATKQSGLFVPASSLETYGMFPEFAALFAETDPRAPLPVILKTFNAKPEEHKAHITWTTTSEINSEQFEIERSGTGKNWQTIGTVFAKNRGSQKLDYSFDDENPGGNQVYYRLKMIDADGTFAHSRIESVKFDISKIIVFPNPVESGKQLQVLSNADNVAKLTIFDFGGKIVYQTENPGDRISMKNLPAGKYILKVLLNNGSESSHVILKK